MTLPAFPDTNPLFRTSRKFQFNFHRLSWIITCVSFMANLMLKEIAMHGAQKTTYFAGC